MGRAHRFSASVRIHHLARLRGRALAARRPGSAARMGSRRAPLRHARHLVPDRRRSLHGLHLHRGSGAGVRGRRDRLLRGAVHHPHLSDPVHRVSAAVERVAQARLHHRGRFRARPLRQPLAGARGDDHRHRGDHAVYRAAARRHAGRDRRPGLRRRGLGRRSAADHRVRHPGRLHLFERPARAGRDRDRQGRPDLHHGLRGHHRHPDRSSAASARSSPRFRRRSCCWPCRRASTHRRLRRLRDAGAGLGAGAVPLSRIR